MIKVHSIPDWFDKGGSRETTLVECVEREAVLGLAPDWFDAEDAYHVCVADGGRITDLEQDARQFQELSFMRAPGVIASATAGAAILTTSTAAAAAVINIAFSIAVSFAVNWAVRQLVGSNRKQTRRSETDSPTYSFLGISSNYNANGAPIPVLYGQHRTGGNVINVYTRVESTPPKSILYILLHLSEGEIEAIGDKTEDGGPFFSGDPNNPLPTSIQIEGQPAENYAGVTAYVRMGTNEQTAIPGFESLSLQFAVTGGLNHTGTAFDLEVTPGNYSQSASEIELWDEEGAVVAYTMGDPADEFSALINFPGGLFRIDSNGDTVVESVEFQIRYVEVDALGVPVVGANYVVLPPYAATNDTTQPVQYEFSGVFYDATTYAPGLTSGYLAMDAGNPPSNNHLRKLSPTGLPDPAVDLVEFTCSCWVRVIPQVTANITHPEGILPTDVLAIAGISNSNTGFRMSLVRFNTIITTNQGLAYKIGLFLIGGTTSQEVVRGIPEGQADAFTQALWKPGAGGLGVGWTHVAVSYKANAAGDGNGRWRFYYDGVLANEQIDNGTLQPRWQDAGPIRVGDDGFNNTWHGDIDEVRFYDRELESFEITQQWGGGTGPEGNASEDGIVAGYHFDQLLELTDYVGSNDLVEFNPSANGVSFVASGSPVQSGGSQTPKNARYKVEIQRLTPQDDESFGGDSADWDTIRLITNEEFEYPNSALLGLRIEATDQLNGNQPTVSVECKGMLVSVWDQGNPTFPSFTREWTQSPAWVAHDIATNRRYGMGQFYEPRNLDMVSLQAVDDRAQEWLDAGIESADLANCSLTYSSSSSVVPGGKALIIQGQKSDFPDPITQWKVGDRFLVTTLTGAANIEEYNTDSGTAHTLYTIQDNTTDWILTLDWVNATDPPTDTFYPQVDVSTGSLFAAIKRYSYDGVFDRPDERAWDALSATLQTARAAPVLAGGRIAVFHDQPRDPVALVTMANVIDGSFVQLFSGKRDRPNVEVVEFLNRDRNYERDFISRESSDVNNPNVDEEVRTRNFALPGVVRAAQIARHADQDLRSFELSRFMLQWDMWVDALTFEIGDVINFAHDVLLDPMSGKIYQDSSVDNIVFLDREVTLVTGKSYEVEILDVTAGVRKTVAVNTGAYSLPETISPGTGLQMSANFDHTPQRGDLYSFGETGLSSVSVAIVDITLSGNDMQRRIRATEYNANVYSDDIDDLPVASATSGSSTGPSDAGIGVPDAPLEIVVKERSGLAESGQVDVSALVTWKMPSGLVGDLSGPGQFPRENREARVAVWVSPEGNERLREVGEVAASDGSFLIRYPFRAGEGYVIALQAVGRRGARRGLPLAPRVRFRPDGVVRPPTGITSLTARVSGDRRVFDLAGGGAAVSRAREIRRGGWVLGQPVATGTGSRELGPVTDWVTAKTSSLGQGRPLLVARERLGSGQEGPAVRAAEAEPPWKSASVDLWDVSEEDTSFGGTKVDLQVLAAPASPELYPPEEQGEKLAFSGSALTGTYTVSATALRESQWVYAQFHVDGDQVHPMAWDSLGFAVGSPQAAAWSVEGPLAPQLGSDTACTILIEERHTSATAFTSEPWTPFRPGRYFARLIEFRVTLTRPSDDYDVRIRRVTGRLTKLPPRRTDHLSIQVFGR